MSTVEQQLQFESLVEYHLRKQWKFARGIKRTTYISLAQEGLAWINVPISLANVFVILDSGRVFAPLLVIMSASAVACLVFTALRVFSAKQLRTQCAELECSATMLRSMLERNPELAVRAPGLT